MRTRIILIFSLWLAIFILGMPAHAEYSVEKIESFNVDISVNQDATINVTEDILYDFNDFQRHGIYRIIPVKYEARLGRYNLKISDISVVDENGKPCQTYVSWQGRYKNIRIGDPDEYVTGQKHYIISYKISKAINYFEDHDELYWNATGNEWDVPINSARVTVRLHKPAEFLEGICFAGSYGGNDGCEESIVAGSLDQAVFSQTWLQPRQGLTFAVKLPKGFLYQPTPLENFIESVSDNYIFGFPVLVLAAIFYWWNRKGRDPQGNFTIVHQFEAPDNLSPAEVGGIIDLNVQNKDITAEIIQLAVSGYLKIHYLPDKGLISKLSKTDNYVLEQLKDERELTQKDFQKKLLGGIFSTPNVGDHDINGEKIHGVKLQDLVNKFYKDEQKVKTMIYDGLIGQGYLAGNPRLAIAKHLGLSFFIGSLLIFLLGLVYGPAGIISGIISGLIMAAFSLFMGKRLKKGVLAKEHILGLKQYLTVAEKDRLKFHNAPAKNPELFEKLLPYAMVLNVEQDWAKQFADIYKEPPKWYSDASGGTFNSINFTNSLNSFSAIATSAMASSPGSSASGGGSGFSGGGFSGGGFGGGGGGSW